MTATESVTLVLDVCFMSNFPSTPKPINWAKL
jgi:hypothetical protein